MDSAARVLVPVVERQVEFYDDQVLAVLVAEAGGPGQIYVPLRPLAERLGLDWSAQYRRVRRSRVLREVSRNIVCTTDGGPQTLQCLPLDYLYGWLLNVDVERVRPELQERIYRYQLECYQVLARAFNGEAAVRSALPSPPTTQLLQIREMGLAIARMAEEQLLQQTKITEHDARLQKAAVVVGDLNRRMKQIETRLDQDYLTDEQASAVAASVAALAMLLTAHNPAKNHFQGVFTELHRRFRAPDYKHIRARQFPAVMDFLEQWVQAGMRGGQDPPAE